MLQLGGCCKGYLHGEFQSLPVRLVTFFSIDGSPTLAMADMPFSSRQFAFPHDEVEPLSRTFTDPRNGWGASIVDGMTTMVCGPHSQLAFDFSSSRCHVFVLSPTLRATERLHRRPLHAIVHNGT